MKIAIRKMGNSQGVIIPQPVLTQLGLDSEAEMSIERDAIVLRKSSSSRLTAASQRVRGKGRGVTDASARS